MLPGLGKLMVEQHHQIQDGSITSTVQANTTAGFSIVKWTGTGATATVGHGLGVKPSIVLIKNTGAVENWVMYHGALGATKNLKLNNQEAAQTTSGAFYDTEPTSSVFYCTYKYKYKSKWSSNDSLLFCTKNWL